MFDLGYYHPIVIHFAIVLCIVGVILRLVSLTGRMRWTDPAALAFIVAGAVAAVIAVQSGHEAHEVVEQTPGVGGAVEEHEEWGFRARNAFLLVAVLEIAAFALARRRAKAGKALRVVAALAGVGAAVVMYEAGEHGGDLVYKFAGGPGVRSGDTTDVTRLLVAGLYQRALADRKAGHKEDAARLFDELTRRAPSDTMALLLGVESRIKDRDDAAGALTQLKALDVPTTSSRRIRMRRGILLADAYKATGSVDSARAVLLELREAFPTAASRIDALLRGL
jgi:uncharacterized membrane protein